MADPLPQKIQAQIIRQTIAGMDEREQITQIAELARGGGADTKRGAQILAASLRWMSELMMLVPSGRKALQEYAEMLDSVQIDEETEKPTATTAVAAALDRLVEDGRRAAGQVGPAIEKLYDAPASEHPDG